MHGHYIMSIMVGCLSQLLWQTTGWAVCYSIINIITVYTLLWSIGFGILRNVWWKERERDSQFVLMGKYYHNTKCCCQCIVTY